MFRLLIAAVVVELGDGGLYVLLSRAGVTAQYGWVAPMLLVIGGAAFLVLLGLYFLTYARYLDANKAEGGTLLKASMQYGPDAKNVPIRAWQWVVLGFFVVLAALVFVIR